MKICKKIAYKIVILNKVINIWLNASENLAAEKQSPQDLKLTLSYPSSEMITCENKLESLSHLITTIFKQERSTDDIGICIIDQKTNFVMKKTDRTLQKELVIYGKVNKGLAQRCIHKIIESFS